MNLPPHKGRSLVQSRRPSVDTFPRDARGRRDASTPRRDSRRYDRSPVSERQEGEPGPSGVQRIESRTSSKSLLPDVGGDTGGATRSVGYRNNDIRVPNVTEGVERSGVTKEEEGRRGGERGIER